MKKSYLYFVVPLVLTAIFSIFYVRYSGEYAAREARIEEQKKIDRQQKLDAEAKAREKAVAEAVATTEKRKREKAEKDAREQKERDARELKQGELRKAQEDSRKFEDQVNRLKKDIQDNKDAIAKIETDKKDLLEQKAFLLQFVKEADANTQKLQDLMDKIIAADQARAAAEKAAKKSS